MEAMIDPHWRKASYSDNGGNCTEVAAVPDAVLVRDTKDPDGPRLAFGRQAWQAFTATVRATA
jgi:Domain of unknown function (DUF397)